jgi:hypothetical protein
MITSWITFKIRKVFLQKIKYIMTPFRFINDIQFSIGKRWKFMLAPSALSDESNQIMLLSLGNPKVMLLITILDR